MGVCFLAQPACLPRCGNLGHRHFNLPTWFWTIHGRRGQSSYLVVHPGCISRHFCFNSMLSWWADASSQTAWCWYSEKKVCSVPGVHTQARVYHKQGSYWSFSALNSGGLITDHLINISRLCSLYWCHITGFLALTVFQTVLQGATSMSTCLLHLLRKQQQHTVFWHW